MNRIFKGIICLLLLAGSASYCVAQEEPFPKPVGFVNDYAKVMTSAKRADMDRLLGRLNEKSGIEIVVVTLKTFRPMTIEQYAVELFQKWGIGESGKDNGILILVAVEDRKVRIEVGYGLEGVVTDAQSKVIINDLMLPAFRQGNYNLGISSGAVMILRIIAQEYNIDLELGKTPLASPSKGRKASPVGSLITLLFFIMIFGLRFGTLFFIMGSGRRSYWSGGGHYGGGGSFGGGFGGFGGGMSGGGGASGSW